MKNSKFSLHVHYRPKTWAVKEDTVLLDVSSWLHLHTCPVGLHYRAPGKTDQTMKKCAVWMYIYFPRHISASLNTGTFPHVNRYRPIKCLKICDFPNYNLHMWAVWSAFLRHSSDCKASSLIQVYAQLTSDYSFSNDFANMDNNSVWKAYSGFTKNEISC